MLSSRFRARAFVAAALLVVLAPAPSRASDLKEPYQLHLVVHVARHRLLTDVFREQVTRELGDGLGAALGKLGTVKVLAKHERLDDVLARGLARSLDEWKERSRVKTHFVLIRYVGGQYEIEARQYDGLTGVPSPVVRRQRTRDRAFVARTAALLVERDFGIVGTIASAPDDKREVAVELRGGELVASMGRWVRVGDVFALVQGNSGQIIPWSYVQVLKAPRDGVCTGRLITRYRLARVNGMRCVKLGTATGPLRLRVVKERPGGETAFSVSLQFRHLGFEGENATVLKVTADDKTDVETASYSRGTFKRLAYVTVLGGSGEVRARVPVPILNDQLVRLPVPAPSEDDNLLGFRVDALLRDVSDSYLDQTNLFKEVNKLSKPEQRATALERVRAGLKRSTEDHNRLSTERAELSKEEKELTKRDTARLAEVGERLRLLKAGEEQLRDHLNQLLKIEKEERDPSRKAYLEDVQRARLLEKQAELGQAIDLLKKLKGSPHASDAMRKELARMEKMWQTKSADHKRARNYAYNKFPHVATSGLKDALVEAGKAFAEFKKHNDVVGPTRLRNAVRAHVGRLVTELGALKPDVNIDDEKPARAIAELTPLLQKLDEEITAYLDRLKGE